MSLHPAPDRPHTANGAKHVAHTRCETAEITDRSQATTPEADLPLDVTRRWTR